MNMKSLAAALKYLTLWGPLSARDSRPELIGSGAIYFPLVGLLIGMILAGVNFLLAVYLDSEILSILSIALLIIATGSSHLDGTKKTFDTLQRSLLTASDRPGEIFGLAATILVILLKVHAIDIMDDKLIANLVITPALARWALVVFVYGYHDRCQETPGVIAANVKLWHLLATTLATLALAVYLVGRKALWIGLSLSVFALLSRTLLHRRQANLTQDNFGAAIDLSEALCLVLLATL